MYQRMRYGTGHRSLQKLPNPDYKTINRILPVLTRISLWITKEHNPHSPEVQKTIRRH